MASDLSASEATRWLFDLYADQVYRYARFVLGDQAEAEDAVQEIFIRVLRSWDQFANRSDPKTWLWSIARNYLYDQLRSRRLHRRFVSMKELGPNEASTSIDEPNLYIEELLASLRLPYRQVITLRYIQDMSTEEVAKVLGWSEAKVRTTLHRGLKLLRKHMANQEQHDARHVWRPGETYET